MFNEVTQALSRVTHFKKSEMIISVKKCMAQLQNS